MSHPKSVTVKLLNKDFQVSCPAGLEEQLQEASEYLDQKMKDIRHNGKVIGLERIAIMAALNLSNELILYRRQKEEYIQTVTEQIDRLQSKIDEALIEGSNS